jgi:hypothetical protein
VILGLFVVSAIVGVGGWRERWRRGERVGRMWRLGREEMRREVVTRLFPDLFSLGFSPNVL